MYLPCVQVVCPQKRKTMFAVLKGLIISNPSLYVVCHMLLLTILAYILSCILRILRFSSIHRLSSDSATCSGSLINFPQVLSVFRGFHTEGVCQVCFSPDGQVSGAR